MYLPSTYRNFTLALVLCLGAGLAWAAPQQIQDKTKDDEPLTTFKANVNVVNVFFNVKNKQKALVPNLTKDDFEVFEDGQPQTIKAFSAESNLPLTLGILIDTSPSQTAVLEYEKEAGTQFLRDVLQPKDEAFVISFDLNVDLLHDFTNSVPDLKKALYRAKINDGGRNAGILPGMGGGPFPTAQRACCTYLYDAVYLAATEKLSKEVGRKAMILLTDGEDEGSKLKIRDAIEAAQKSDSICYVIMINDRGVWQGFGERDMKKLSEETGGRVIDVGNKPDKLRDAFRQIAQELRGQYNIAYTPTNRKLDGTFRKVEIRPKDKTLKIQSRLGYYAVKAD